MRRPVIALVAGLVIGGACVAGAAALWADGDPDETERTPAELLDEFAAAWSGWRQATAVYEERLERTDSSGEVQYVELVEVSKVGENSLTVSESAGTVFGGLDGQGISCSMDPDERNCFVEGEYEVGTALEHELDDVRRAVADGTHRLSDTGDGCWRIRRVGDVESPLWGDQFDVCFDRRSGIAVSEVTRTRLGVDTVTRTVSRTDVTEADLRAMID